MGFLVEPIQDVVYVGRKKYKINAAFDVVLEVQRLYREGNLSDIVKIEQALKMFGVQRPGRMSNQQKTDLLNDIYQNCVNTVRRPRGRKQVPVLDFEEDGEYIYSSFLLDYGIDLIDAQGTLHWKKFMALFQGLSDRTKICEVMKVRGMDIPRYNGQNQKQIQDIREMKSYYALPVRGGGGQKGLDALFGALEAQAMRERR